MFTRATRPGQRVFGDFDAVFQEFFDPVASGLRRAFSIIPADVYSEGDVYVIEAELPGVERSRVSVKAQGRLVEVIVREKGDEAFSAPQEGVSVNVQGEAEAAPASSAKPRKVEHKGRFHGPRQAVWEFDRELDTNGITARLADGILTLSVPSARSHGSRDIDIE